VLPLQMVRKLIILDSRDVEEAFKEKPFLVPYGAWFGKIRGLYTY